MSVRSPVRRPLTILLIPLLVLGWISPVRAEPTAAGSACEIAGETLPLEGGTLRYSRAGRGPAVLLLHGLFAQKEQWHPLLCRLAASGFQAIAPDLPGFGASAGFPIEDYDLARQAELLHGLVSALGLRDLTLVANSMGGTIAALYLQRYPHGAARLAFVGPPLGVEDWGPGVRQAIVQGINPFIPADPAQFALELDLLFAQPPQVPDAARDALLADYAARDRHYRQVWDIVNLYDRALDDSLEIAVPVLILWGEDDGIFPVAGARSLHRRLPQSTLAILPQTGHLPMLESPAETAAALVPFLKGSP